MATPEKIFPDSLLLFQEAGKILRAKVIIREDRNTGPEMFIDTTAELPDSTPWHVLIPLEFK